MKTLLQKGKCQILQDGNRFIVNASSPKADSLMYVDGELVSQSPCSGEATIQWIYTSLETFKKSDYFAFVADQFGQASVVIELAKRIQTPFQCYDKETARNYYANSENYTYGEEI